MLLLHNVKASLNFAQSGLFLFEVFETFLVHLDDVDVRVALFEVLLQLSDTLHDLALLGLQERDLLLREVVSNRRVGQVVFEALQALAQTLRGILTLCSLKVDDLALAWSHAAWALLLNHPVVWHLNDNFITEHTAKLKILLLEFVSIVLDPRLDSLALVVHKVPLFHGFLHRSFGLGFLVFNSL